MSAPFLLMKNKIFLPLFSVVILGTLTFYGRNTELVYVSILFMLLFPFVDRRWQKPGIKFHPKSLVAYLGILALMVVFIFVYKLPWPSALSIMLLVALPEEWFFRGYLMQRLTSISRSKWAGNLLTSTVFALLHFPQQGLIGLSVFLPSLVYGWVYQKTRDLFLVILLHALSNVFFIVYLRKFFD